MAIKPARRYKDMGPLQDILLRACPADHKGVRSLPVFAEALGVSYQYVYKWISSGKLPPKFVNPIVDLSSGRVSQEELLPFAL